MSHDVHSPADRAGAVLRAAEAAAAAARAGTPAPAPPTPTHEMGAPARLLAAASELEAHVAQARAQLDALAGTLDRVGRDPARAE